MDQKSDAVMVLNMILDQLVNVEWVAHQQLILAKVRKREGKGKEERLDDDNHVNYLNEGLISLLVSIYFVHEYTL